MSGIEQLAEMITTDLEQRLPGQRKTQRDKLALLVATMRQVRSANLMDVAACLPRPAERLVRFKENQPTLHTALAKLCAERPCLDSHETVDRHRHGRQEHRRVEVFDTAGQMNAPWKKLIACVARVSRLTYVKDTRSGLWPTREETGYYACQTRRDAKFLARAIRAHWGIKTRDHYVRDVPLGEDASRIRYKPGVMARLRSVALNILRANGVQNISQALYANALSLERLLALGIP